MYKSSVFNNRNKPFTSSSLNKAIDNINFNCKVADYIIVDRKVAKPRLSIPYILTAKSLNKVIDNISFDYRVANFRLSIP